MRKRIFVAAVLAVALTPSAHASVLSGFRQSVKPMQDAAATAAADEIYPAPLKVEPKQNPRVH